MSDNQEINSPEVNPKRPVFLTVIGILTFINSGYGLLSSLLSYATGPVSADDMEKLLANNVAQINLIREQGMAGLASIMENMLRTMEYTNASHYLAVTINLVIYALAVAGTIMMFKRRKLGFHLYIISCLIRILSFYAYVPVQYVSGLVVGYFVFTSMLFIFMYSRNLKWMH